MIIGVTGGVGSGKTVFVRELERLGARIVDADEVARELIDERRDIRKAIRDAFGPRMFDASGQLRRRGLGRVVFSDLEKLKTLNRIVHLPLMDAIGRRVSSIQGAEKETTIVVDMAILYEAGLEWLFDVVVVVVAPLEQRIRWLVEERGWSREEILDRVGAQMDDQERAKRADVVIENTGDLGDLRRKARDLYRKISGKRRP